MCVATLYHGARSPTGLTAASIIKEVDVVLFGCYESYGEIGLLECQVLYDKTSCCVTYKRTELGLQKEFRYKLFHHYIPIDNHKRTTIGRPSACRVTLGIACILEHLVELVRKCDLLFCVGAFHSHSRRRYVGIHIINGRNTIHICNVSISGQSRPSSRKIVMGRC